MSGFAPRCAGCGAWRRARGLGGGEATPWRRAVTFVLAVAAVAIALVDVQQSRRAGWLGHIAVDDAPAAAPAAPTARAASTPESPAVSSSSPVERPVSVAHLPGDGNAGGPPSTPRTAAAPTTSKNFGMGAATGVRAQTQSSISSTIVDWFQRVRFRRGYEPSIPRDTIDSAAAAVGRRLRTGVRQSQPIDRKAAGTARAN